MNPGIASYKWDIKTYTWQVSLRMGHRKMC
jgi:hypothetical protein